MIRSGVAILIRDSTTLDHSQSTRRPSELLPAADVHGDMTAHSHYVITRSHYHYLSDVSLNTATVPSFFPSITALRYLTLLGPVASVSQVTLRHLSCESFTR